MSVPVIIRNLDHPDRTVSVEAEIDLSHAVAVVPQAIAKQIGLKVPHA